MLPLYNYLAFMNGRYGVALIGAAVFLSILTEKFAGIGRATLAIHVFVSSATIMAMLFSICFILFIIYKLMNGSYFDFLSLSFSAFLVFVFASFTLVLSKSWTEGYDFHILHLLLPVFVSAFVGVIFSGAIRIAEKFISS